MKKIYESPNLEKCILNVQAGLMNNLSTGDYGWVDKNSLDIDPVS